MLFQQLPGLPAKHGEVLLVYYQKAGVEDRVRRTGCCVLVSEWETLKDVLLVRVLHK